jgi:aminodeoxyfutalosine synthase
LRDIAAKVRDGVRLDEADALVCLTTPHLLHLGKLADTVRRRLHGNVTYFNINRHINPTNVCVYTYNCKFCSFAALKGEDHAWEMSHEDVYATPPSRAATGSPSSTSSAASTPTCRSTGTWRCCGV